MTAISVGQAMTEIATIFTSVYGAERLELPNTAFEPPADLQPWAHMTFHHVQGQQSSLADQNGQRRFTANGLVIISVMTALGAGLRQAYDAAEAVIKLYQGKTTASDVWFTNVHLEERDQRGARPTTQNGAPKWFQIDVLVQFEYDTIN